jgi:hypothetical protein
MSRQPGITTINILGDNNVEIARFNASVTSIEKAKEVAREAHQGGKNRLAP